MTRKTSITTAQLHAIRIPWKPQLCEESSSPQATITLRVRNKAARKPHHVSQTQPRSPQAAPCCADATTQPASRTMLRGRNHAAHRPHHVACTQLKRSPWTT